MKRIFTLLASVSILPVVCSGCLQMPEVSRQPQVHNPFPQLSEVAVAPFFNLSQEKTLNGRDVAVHYYNELQQVPGFRVVPVGVVEERVRQLGLNLSSAEEARQLAQSLGVDAVVIGAITDYSPYYPPRMGLQVEWYAANPGFHPIPPGYGLPWGTREEADIPHEVIFEAEMALAREQMQTQTPVVPPTPEGPGDRSVDAGSGKELAKRAPCDGSVQPTSFTQPAKSGQIVYQETHTVDRPADGTIACPTGNCGDCKACSGVVLDGQVPCDRADFPDVGLPQNWPDPRGLIPQPPHSSPPTICPTNTPVLTHTRIYNGNDSEFTTALADYYYYQDEARFGGWQAYLQRSDDFVRFCCHMHIWETLVARGGASETRVVWRRYKPR